MAKSAQKSSTGTEDVSGLAAAMMGGNPAAVHAWQEMMTQGARFMSERFQQDVEAQHALLQCKTPAELVQVLSAYFQKAFEQYPEEAKRMLEIMSDTTQEVIKEAKTGRSREYDDIPL